MATIKSYTDLGQSKKLAEMLPPESADMCWYIDDDNIPTHTPDNGFYRQDKNHLPCWSLAALLEIIPKKIEDFNVLRIDITEKDFSIWYDEYGYGTSTKLPDITMECPVDACVEMIEKLNELKLL